MLLSELIVFPFIFLSTPTDNSSLLNSVQYSILLSRNVLPHGLPNEFSFGATFRLSPGNKGVKDTWSLIYIDDFRGQLQFAIKMNGQDKQIEVQYRNYNYDLVTIVFAGGAVPDVGQFSTA